MNVAGVWRGWVAAVVAAGLGVIACGLEKSEPWLGDDEPPSFSAARLGEDSPIRADMLTPAEREALERDRGTPVAFGDDELGAEDGEEAKASTSEEKGSEKAGKLALSLLTVGITLAAAAAPYLLF